ncbi:STAS domain-containing protein [Mucilaginibacter segetis]|uniref:STAS domain-containing protein n=1 Tax=Mucilaginibacter segetis TaxID=2793071 RepID=A0A934PTS6_9SPHI|nr:STAS domain-containing protein [Mucilaginibacter segetis]MBK0379016.1 STAS domain-containing protein [Mucilaginibacter segetis]
MILLTNNYKNALVAEIQIKEANLTISEQFKQQMIELIEQGNSYIIVNFVKVIYVDSSFLGALVAALKYAIPHKAEVVVCGLNKDILGLFQLIRLDKAFKIFGNVDDAAVNGIN